MKLSISLRTRFAITFAALIIILTLLLTYVAGKKATEAIKLEVGSSLSQTAFYMADNLDQYMWSRYGEIMVLAKLKSLSNLDNISEINSLLNELKNNFPAYSWIGVTDPKGLVVASTDEILSGFDISERPVYKEALNGQFIGDVHDAVLLAKLLPNPTGEAMKFVDISTPLRNSHGELIGVLASHLSWRWADDVRNTIQKPIENYKGVEVFVISKNDNAILLGPDNLIGQKLEIPSIENARKGKNSWSVETWPDGKSYLTGYAVENGYENYPGLGWTVLVRQPIDVAYKPIDKLKSYIGFLGFGSSIIFAILGWFSAGNIVKPLKRIAIAADKFRFGEKIEISEESGIKDIDMLSSTINDLVRTLNTQESALGKMVTLAHHDKLTGLPNRVALDLYIEKTMQGAMYNNEALIFMYLDLDGFKPINDTYGHGAGDIILQQVASRLKSSIKPEDMVARIGGDEFLIVTTSPSDYSLNNGKALGNALIQSIREPFTVEGEELKVGCSVGGAVWPLQHSDVKQAIIHADEALYYSKRNGKNRCSFFKVDF